MSKNGIDEHSMRMIARGGIMTLQVPRIHPGTRELASLVVVQGV